MRRRIWKRRTLAPKLSPCKASPNTLTDKAVKIKIGEDDEIVSFGVEESDMLDKYFRGTNAETAYMLERYCGLRINECYGLLWSNIDFDNDCIHIEQQMQYQEGLIGCTVSNK